MRFEDKSLRLQSKLAPGLVPDIYHSDEEMALIIMENLDRHEVMRKPLVARRVFPEFAEHISTFLARTLFFTSDLYLPGVEKKQLQKEFINPHLCKIQEEFVFTNPFMESPDNNWNPILDKEVAQIRQNGELKIAVAMMKKEYMTNAQAIIHSDLHTGSIMLNEKETRVIDPEFGFCGPMGFDIGALLENIILNHLSHFAHTPDKAQREKYQEYLLGMVREIWQKFAQKFEELWIENPNGDLMPRKYWDYPGGEEDFAKFRSLYIQGVLRDTIGFAGCKMLRRMMGIVTVWDFSSIEDNEKRAVCERMALRIGSRWVLEHNRMNSIDDFLAVVREEAYR
jgi:5-methylthioribose kinase